MKGEWSRSRVLGEGRGREVGELYLLREAWLEHPEGEGGRSGGGDSCWNGLNGKLLGGFGGATDFEKHFIRKHSKHTQK